MKVRHLLNLKIAGITFLFALLSLVSWAQETTVYSGNIAGVGNKAVVTTTDSFAMDSGLEGYYWFVLHEDTAIRYYYDDCRFETNPLIRLEQDRNQVQGFTIEGGKGHTALRYLHYHKDSILEAMHILLEYGASAGRLVSNIPWNMQVEKCSLNGGAMRHVWANQYFELAASRFRFDYSQHSQSRLYQTDAPNDISLCFKGVPAEELPTLLVLEYLLKQEKHSFQQNMVQSGLCIRAEFSFNANNVGDFIGLSFRPNPFAIPKSIEVLFDELNKMPLFNYTTKEQLDLAKMQIAMDLEFKKDRTFSNESWSIPFLKEGRKGIQSSFMDSVQSVTKVDLMHFINTHLHEQPFFLVVRANTEKLESLEGILRSTEAMNRYKASFTDAKDTKLDDAALAELENVAYILNLTYWAPIEIHLYGSKKRSNEKREKAIKEYLKKAGVGNPITVVYHRNTEDNIECATFSIAQSEK